MQNSSTLRTGMLILELIRRRTSYGCAPAHVVLGHEAGGALAATAGRRFEGPVARRYMLQACGGFEVFIHR